MRSYLYNGKLYSEMPDEGGVPVFTKSVLRLEHKFIRGTELQDQCNITELVRCMMNLKLIVMDKSGVRYAPTGRAPLTRDLIPEILEALGKGKGRSIRDLFI